MAGQQSLAARTLDSFDPAALAGAVLMEPADGTPAGRNIPDSPEAAIALDTRRSSMQGEVDSVLKVPISYHFIILNHGQ